MNRRSAAVNGGRTWRELPPEERKLAVGRGDEGRVQAAVGVGVLCVLDAAGAGALEGEAAVRKRHRRDPVLEALQPRVRGVSAWESSRARVLP
eukprot:1909606-Rhodomonas_salina.1